MSKDLITTPLTSVGRDRQSGNVSSVIRVFDITELLAKHESGLTFTEIRTHLRLPKSSTSALLHTMLTRGYLYHDDTGRYHLGIRYWEAGQVVWRTLGIDSFVLDHLRRCADSLLEAVQMAVLDGWENIYIAKVEPDRHLRLESNIGSRLPAHATALGKVLLAGLDPDECESRLAKVTLERFTDRTITDKNILWKHLQAIREDGFGTDDGEYTTGVYCVAVPILDSKGKWIAAISFSVPKARLEENEVTIDDMQAELDRCSKELSRDVGNILSEWTGQIIRDGWSHGYTGGDIQ